jgi:hypothetical protein
LKVYDPRGYKVCNIERLMESITELSTKLPKYGVSVHRVEGPYFIPD